MLLCLLLGLPEVWAVPIAWGWESVVLELVAGYGLCAALIACRDRRGTPPNKNRVEVPQRMPHICAPPPRVVLLSCTSDVWRCVLCRAASCCVAWGAAALGLWIWLPQLGGVLFAMGVRLPNAQI